MKKITGSSGFIADLYMVIKEQSIPNCLNHSNIRKLGKFTDSFYKASNTLISKLDKDSLRKLFIGKSFMNKHEQILNKVLVEMVFWMSRTHMVTSKNSLFFPCCGARISPALWERQQVPWLYSHFHITKTPFATCSSKYRLISINKNSRLCNHQNSKPYFK